MFYTNHVGYFTQLSVKETDKRVIEYEVSILREMSLKKLTFNTNHKFLR